MAQLKDLIVNGASRFIGTLYASTIYAPTTSGGGTYGPGSSGQVLLSNGTTAYWGSLAASSIPNLDANKITSGILPIARGGTNASTAAAARANLGAACQDFVELSTNANVSSTIAVWNNLANNTNAIISNKTSGVGHGLIFTKVTDLNSVVNGTILRWGSSNNYIRILRNTSGTWQTNEWEKISAGYADSAGQVSHSLTIGSYEFDGSAAVSIPIYNGS